jgi:hypothetical protein
VRPKRRTRSLSDEELLNLGHSSINLTFEERVRVQRLRSERAAIKRAAMPQWRAIKVARCQACGQPIKANVMVGTSGEAIEPERTCNADP